jgi:hypothetical protein
MRLVLFEGFCLGEILGLGLLLLMVVVYSEIMNYLTGFYVCYKAEEILWEIGWFFRFR